MSSLYTTERNRNSCAEDNSLNSDISPQEVTESIDHLKANKAAGLDGIIPEVFKHSCDKVLPFLVHLLNKVLLTYSERYGGLGIFRHQYFLRCLMLRLSRCSCMVQKFGI